LVAVHEYVGLENTRFAVLAETVKVLPAEAVVDGETFTGTLWPVAPETRISTPMTSQSPDTAVPNVICD
jgi:hypothetical protein